MDFSHLLASNDQNISSNVLDLIVERADNKVLLLEEALSQKYIFPSGEVLKDESINMALQRVLMEKTGLTLSEVSMYLMHQDVEKVRHLFFVVKAHDPDEMLESSNTPFAWADPKEAFGYPISEMRRQAMHQYLAHRQLD